jgi:MFS family permease
MSVNESAAITTVDTPPWYRSVTRYQWIVLILASLGWVFDVFEGQIFVASMNEAMPSLLPPGAGRGEVAFYNNLAFGAFLLGGALGGVVFGILSDRIGRKRALTYTILVYSAFTCVSALAQNWWQMTLFRFLVAMGTGGEWAVAAALVAEVFPQQARAWSLGLFHASSVLGSYLAIAAGAFLVANPDIGWRWGFVLGAAPALLIVWVRRSLKEPERWERTRADASEVRDFQPGRIVELSSSAWRRNTIVGVGLAAVGLATYWGVHVYGKDRLRQVIEARYVATLPAPVSDSAAQEVLRANLPAIKRWEMLGLFLIVTGGGAGLVSFGPLCERLGRRGAFLLFHLGGLVSALVLFQWLTGVAELVVFLPVFGFLTLGMHAGYAIYFPELFPTRLRSTGAGFCFNVGRVLAAPILFLSGWMQKDWRFTLANACSSLSLLFAVGIVLLAFAPETWGQDLPE